MKKIYLILSVALLLQHVANGQDNAKITSLLAQMPAKDAAALKKNMSAVAALGEDGYVSLISGLSPQGKGNNAPIEYAIGGFTAYVTQPGNDELRKMSISAYTKALQKLSDKQNKSFIISQFDLVGNDDAVAVLQPYLTDNDLADPAARALAKINTAASKAALLSALDKANGAAKLFIVEALGDVRLKEAAKPINALVTSGDAALAKTAMYALAYIADPSSEPVLAAAAAKAGYKYEKTDATGAYLTYAEQFLKKGNTALVQKIANSLILKAKTPDVINVRTNALQLLVATRTDRQQLLLTAAGDANKQYRDAALRYALPYLTPATTGLWVKKLATVNDSTKTDILYMLGQSTQTKAALPAVLALAKTKDLNLKTYAVNAAVNIGQEQVLGDLIKLMTTANADEMELMTTSIARMKGAGVTTKIAAAIPTAKENVQVALIDILDSRAATAQYGNVYAQLKSKNVRTRHAAYAALSHVSAKENAPALFALLNETTDEESAVQDAIISVLNISGDSDQKVDLVLQQLASAPENKKPLFYKMLASIGTPKALKAVTDAYASGNDQTKAAAVNALVLWPNDGAASTLIKIARETKDADLQSSAISAYLGSVKQNTTYAPEQRLLKLREAMSVAQDLAQKKQILREIEQAKCYSAILFAGRFLDDAELQATASNTVVNIALAGTYDGAIVKGLLEKASQHLAGSKAAAQKAAVTKYLAAMKAGEGFVQIFNGKDLTGWKGLVADPIKRSKMDAKTLEEAQLKADAMAKDSWKVVNGELVFQSHGDNLATVKKYRDVEMLVDWKIIDDKKGQGDAGIYLRGSPQVQIWDLARSNVGAQVGSGGLYNNQVNPSKPLLVANNKLDEWNTFRIVMKGDRVSVWLNGQLVTDNVMLENYWDRKQPIFPEEQIELQAHGSPVAYRDIYIRELPAEKPFELSKEEKKEGYKVLFEGTNMFNWTGNTVDYIIDSAANLAIHPQLGKGGNLYTKDEYSDFIFRFEFKLTPGANNGLGIRAPLTGDAAYTGMELQILDNEHPMYKDLHVYQYHGSIYGTLPAKRGFLKPTGEWNYEEVIVKGPKIKVILNGTVILDADITDARKNGTPDKKDHPGLLRDSGHIGFLGHGSVVEFKNIRIKDLSKK